ncbi:MAG: hypothetical protein J5842_05885, partial [Lachnospiraceae bacterium]|nr:hypothetical protein [Lachnospiraceae bacterium]
VSVKTEDEEGEARDQNLREVDIYTGYITNKAEAMKMSEESYARTVAKVIFAWLLQEDEKNG